VDTRIIVALPVRRPFLALVVCAAALLGGTALRAQPVLTQDLEYQVKAAYIFNLIPFTTWPPNAFTSPGAPLTVCVAQPNPFGAALERTFRNEHVGTHPIAVATIAAPGAVEDCQVLFIAEGADPSGALEHAANGLPVLTVGEGPRFAKRGGIITFVTEQGRVRFDVNRTAAGVVKLQFSSKVLQVARRIS